MSNDPGTPVTVVVPVFNEAEALHDALRRLGILLTKLPPGSEVVLVDDGSDDGSAEILAAALPPGVRAFQHARNRGYGATLKSGIAAAKNDLIAITDADGTYPHRAIPKLAALVASGQCAMAVGARPVGDQPMIRRPAKAVLRALAQHLTGVHIPDLNSGLRVFWREDAVRLRNLLPDKFSFTTTITMALLTEGAEVRFVPIRYAARVGSSKIRPIRDTLDFLLLILRTTLAFQPLKVFGPLALVFLIAGAGLMIARLLMEHPFGVATTVICFVTGIQLLALGLLADLINRRSM